MDQLKSLTKVSDGNISPLAGDVAYNFVLFLPWGALWLGLHVISGGKLALFLAVMIAAAGWFTFSRIPDAAANPAPGVWLTGRKALWRCWIDRAAALAGMGVSTLAALIADFKGASTWAQGYLWVLTAAFAIQAGYLFWRGRAFLRREVELRVDADGLYSRELGGTLTWDQIERIAPRERGDRQRLRLVVGPNRLLALPAARREHGGPIELGLSAAVVSREEVLAAMIAVRPSLATTESAPTSEPAMVQPITGASTDDSPRDDAVAAVAVPVLIGMTIGSMG